MPYSGSAAGHETEFCSFYLFKSRGQGGTTPCATAGTHLIFPGFSAFSCNSSSRARNKPVPLHPLPAALSSLDKARSELVSVSVPALKAHPEHYQLSVVVQSQTMTSPACPSVIQLPAQNPELNNPLISMECFFSLCQQCLWLSAIVPKGPSPRF